MEDSDNTVQLDPGNSETKAFVDPDGVNTYVDTDSDSDATPLTEKTKVAGSRVAQRADTATDGSVSTAVTAGRELYSRVPEPIRDGIALGTAAARAYPELQKQPTVGGTVQKAREMSGGSALFTPEAPPDSPGAGWDQDMTVRESPPSVSPVPRSEYESLASRSTVDSRSEFSVGPTKEEFVELSPQEQMEQIATQVTEIDEYDRDSLPPSVDPPGAAQDVESYQRAQLAAHAARNIDRLQNPAVAAELWDGLTITGEAGGRKYAPLGAYSPQTEELTVNNVGNERYEVFEHEMMHRLVDVSGLEYSGQSRDTTDMISPDAVAQRYDYYTGETDYPQFNFDEGNVEGQDDSVLVHDQPQKTADEGLLFDPQDSMLKADNSDGDLQTLGAAEWRDDVVEEVETDYDVHVDDPFLPDAEDDPIDPPSDPDSDSLTEFRTLASEANKAVYKQQLLVNHATQTDGLVTGLAATRQVKEVTLGQNSYSVTSVGETLARTSELLQSTTDTVPPEQIKQLQEHHPELVDAYRGVYEPSERAQQYLE